MENKSKLSIQQMDLIKENRFSSWFSVPARLATSTSVVNGLVWAFPLRRF